MTVFSHLLLICDLHNGDVTHKKIYSTTPIHTES